MDVFSKKFIIHFYTGDYLNNEILSKTVVGMQVLYMNNGESNKQPEIVLKNIETNELVLITITNSHKFRLMPFYKT